MDFEALWKCEQIKNRQLFDENQRLVKNLPSSFIEVRTRERQLQERLSRYEQAIVDYENEKGAMASTIKKKDEDIAFIKSKYEETNALWHQENLEKQKMEAVIDQQYRESMELDTFRRKAEDDKNTYRAKNQALK